MYEEKAIFGKSDLSDSRLRLQLSANIPRSFPIVLLLISGLLFYLGFNSNDPSFKDLGAVGGFVLVIVAICLWLWERWQRYDYAKKQVAPVDVGE